MKRSTSRYAGVYWRRGRIFVQPYEQTTAGVLIGGQPVEILEDTVPDKELGKALQQALRHWRGGVKHPDNWEKVPQPLNDAAGVKSWPVFVKGARGCETIDDGIILKLTPSRNAGARGGFQPLIDQTIELASNAEAEEIGQAIREALSRAE